MCVTVFAFFTYLYLLTYSRHGVARSLHGVALDALAPFAQVACCDVSQSVSLPPGRCGACITICTGGR